MNRTRWLVPFFTLAAMSPFACDDDPPDPGAGGAQGVPCELEDECEDDDPCTFDFCIDRVCQHDRAPNGPQPGAQQTDGDCQELVCNDGVSSVQNDDDDAPEDDGVDCNVPVCNAGVLGSGPAEAGQFCNLNDGGGVCDGEGTCSCAAPSAGLPHFVHPTLGTDDASHGGAWGECAFRTLDYALANATGEIILAEGTYDDTAVTFPITLTGQQVVRCATNNEELVTTIVGSGMASGTLVTVVLGGTSNGVETCILDGGGAADTVVMVDSAGGGEYGHYLYRSEVTGAAAAGIRYGATGDNLQVVESQVQGNTTVGLDISGAGKIGYLENNVFAGNGTDVICSEAMPDVTGNGNAIATCTTCANCPF